MGTASLVLAVALFAAGGVSDRYRLLWAPFVVVGAFLASLNFTPLDVSTELTGFVCCAIGFGALMLAAGGEWLRSITG